MLTLVLFIVFMMLVYKNSMFYSLTLLFVSITTLFFIVIKGSVSSLSALMLVIVYVGAIIILVGYICAVTPNLYMEPDYSYMYVGLFNSLFLFLVLSDRTIFHTKAFNLVDYFYSFRGVFLFLFLVLMLFLTLLIVTSHDNSPRGPFRSLV